MPFTRRAGWTSLCFWALFGVALEVAHGWKLSDYLDDPLAQKLLTLAHAHGVGLALVLLVWGEAGAPLIERPQLRARALAAAGALIPLGFALGAMNHPESDPAMGIFAVPLGALLLFGVLGETAWRSWRD